VPPFDETGVNDNLNKSAIEKYTEEKN